MLPPWDRYDVEGGRGGGQRVPLHDKGLHITYATLHYRMVLFRVQSRAVELRAEEPGQPRRQDPTRATLVSHARRHVLGRGRRKQMITAGDEYPIHQAV